MNPSTWVLLLFLAAGLLLSGAVNSTRLYAEPQSEASEQGQDQDQSEPNTQPEIKPESHFATISVNEVEKTGIFPAFSQNGSFLIEEEAFLGLEISLPQTALVLYRGRYYVPLAAIAGLTYTFDPGQQHLSLICEASCFPSRQLTGAWQAPQPDPTPLGMFINYDLLAEKSDTNEFIGGLAEIGIFSDFGSGTLTFSGRDFSGDAELIRLDTSWTIDWPNKRQRLRLGDSISQHGGWGRAVRFGGIQFGTDFGLQPGFISFPTPTITGSAALPSTAEIFVNGVRRAGVDIEPGAFTIEQPPVITGSGNLLVVVRDLLGRETIINQPFYASRNLLRPALSEYSIEAGFLRTNYGSRSNDYGEPFVAGSFRKGLSQHFTAGLHAELSSKRAGIGPYLDWKTPIGGILSSAAALSLKDGKAGALVQLDFSWQSDKIGVSVSNEWISAHFSRLGNQNRTIEPRMRTSANLGLDVADDSALSVNYLRIDERNSPNLQIASVNLSQKVGDIGAVSANLSRSFGDVKDTAIFLVFTAQLGENTTASASLDHGGGRWSGDLRASRNAPGDGGFGYRAGASFDDGKRGRAGITYNSTKGIAALDYSQSGGNDTARLGLRGGLVVMAGDVFFSNSVDDSFAVVQVADYEDVGVLRDNRPVGKTNSGGRVLVAGLRPFEENRLSINPLDLPLTADIGSVSLMPVPRRRSGVFADFPINRTVAATLKLTDSAGNPLPPGTVLRVIETGAEFPIGFGGTAYIVGLEHTMTLRAHTAGGDCSVTIAAVKPGPFPAKLGTRVCLRETAGERP